MDTVKLWAGPLMAAIGAVCFGFASWAMGSPDLQDSGSVADWAQAFTSFLAVIATALAVVWAGWSARLEQRRASQVAIADQLTAAYLIARIAGLAVIHSDRWTRLAALEPAQREHDLDEYGRYGERWAAWAPERLEAYLENMTKLDASKIIDGDFIRDLVTVRSRVHWYRHAVASWVANPPLFAPEDRLLPIAAYDVMEALARLRGKVSGARRLADLPTLVVDPLPPSAAPGSDDFSANEWEQWRRLA